MQTDGLNVSGVTSDGCSFQVNALNWGDPESIQARGEQFSQLLFISCICHRLQNVIITLFKENAHYRHLLEQALAAAVYLRKPGARAEIGGIYPAHCATRLIYDYSLVRFRFNACEQAKALIARGEMELSPDVRLLRPLFQKVFDTMRVFETH
jgi:hypothetical protein